MGLIVGPGIYIGGASKNHISTEEYAGSQSPYTFIASKGKLKSLIRYGKCEQSGTPTPNVPRDIVINNGVVTMVDDELPSGYTRLSYIESDGTSGSSGSNGYVDTGIIINSIDTDVEIDFQLTDTYAPSPRMAWGYMGTSSSLPRWGFGAYSSKWLGSPNGTVSRGELDTDRHVAVMRVYGDSNSAFYNGTIDGETLYSADNLSNVSLFEGNGLSVYLFARNNNNTAANFVPCKIFRFKVYKAGALTHDLVPCKDGNDTLGFYDLVAKSFYGASGTLIEGAADYSHAHVGVIGTDEVITLSAVGVADQTATVENLFAVGNVKDEQDIISGTVTRRCGVCVYDGTQQVGDTFISMTGEKTVGTIIVYLLDEPVVEQVTPQPMTTQKGENTLTIDSEVTSPEFKIVFPKGAGEKPIYELYNYTCDGTINTFIDTGIALFDAENVSSFRIELEFDNLTDTPYSTIMECKGLDSKTYGLTVRRSSEAQGKKFQFNLINILSNREYRDINSGRLIVIYDGENNAIKINDSTVDFTGSINHTDTLTIGGCYDSNKTPQRFSTCHIKSLKIYAKDFDWSKVDYMYFEALSAGSTVGLTTTGSVNPVLYYSYDKTNWILWDKSTLTLTNVGDKIYFYSKDPLGKDRNNYATFTGTGQLKIGGDLSTLASKKGGITSFTSFAFRRTFYQNTAIISASEAYFGVKNPDIVNIDGTNSFSGTFAGCSNMVDAPTFIHVSDIVKGSCEWMFENCSSLVTAPVLYAKTVDNGYTSCPYSGMFKNCSSLNYVKCLSTNLTSVRDWLIGVSPTGTFVKSRGVNWTTGTSGIPSGWTVIEVDE